MSFILLALLSGAAAGPVVAAPQPITIIQDASQGRSKSLPPPIDNSLGKSASAVGLFSQDDYPSEAMRNGEEGTVAVKLDIGTDGRVSGCTVEESSHSASLDTATCRILTRRARFRPARDAKGNPVTDTFRQRVTWALPVVTQPAVDRMDRVTVALGPSGIVISCRAEALGKSPRMMPADECNGMQEFVDMFAEKMPSLRAGGYQAVVIEMRHYFPAAGQPQWATAAANADVIIDAKNRFEIGADGKVVQCQFLGNEGLVPLPPTCRPPDNDPFEALPPDVPQRVRVGFGQFIATAIRK